VKKATYIYILAVSAIVLVSSCDKLPVDGPPSEEEIVEGLKTALSMGTDSASSQLSAHNGYFKDEAVKIILPKEVQTAKGYLSELKLDGLISFDEIEEGINHAAEDAASESGDIFLSAIKDLSITDGLTILKGQNPAGTKSGAESAFDSLAATNYLKSKTFGDLVTVFSTPINTALDENKIGGVSVNDVWAESTSKYNSATEIYNLNPFTASINPISTNIGEFCTEKALDGLFFKIGAQERAIRRNPFKWAVDIIEKVFGWLD